MNNRKTKRFISALHANGKNQWLKIYMNSREVAKLDVSGKNYPERCKIQSFVNQALHLINS